MAHVLVIDDDAAIRSMVQVLLSRSGHTVECAADGVEGSDRVETHRPDVILLDLMMPRRNGSEFLALLESTAPDLVRRVIIMSASSPAISKALGATHNVWRVFSKPFDIIELRTAVEECLSRQDRSSDSSQGPGQIRQSG
jgi:DNA-binding response OmpR family regulator